MITEKDYCDKDLSDALKELGFPTKMTFIGEQATIEIPINSGQISLYEAQKWLREEKGIIISPAPYENFKWCACIYRIKFPDELCKEFDSYEEALSEGIKEAVKILKDGNNS